MSAGRGLPGREALARLRERYTAEPVPPCPICGHERSVASIGGGHATVYACSPLETDPDDESHLIPRPGYDQGRGQEGYWEHYQHSQWTQYRPGDPDVPALLALVDALTAAGDALAAMLYEGAPYQAGDVLKALDAWSVARGGTDA